jgi:hypothetical protein
MAENPNHQRGGQRIDLRVDSVTMKLSVNYSQRDGGWFTDG